VKSAATRIILLGRIAIERDGDAEPSISLTGRRAEVVFAFLAVEHRRSVDRDELANVLWPELLPDTWNAALRGVLSEVRRFLERGGLNPAETLIAEQGRLRFQLPPGAALDIDEARDALSEARILLSEGDPAGAAVSAGVAAEAAELTFLPFHEDGWAGDVRAELDRLHVDALELQTEAFAIAGDPRAALTAADRLVRADPYLEAAHRLRIALFGELGDRAGALKAFERCKALLESELGIEPSPETTEVLRQAIQGASVPAPAAGSPSAAAYGEGTVAQPAAEVAPVSPFGAYSALVVEDHDFQRRTTLTLLRGLGVRHLREASDGRAALELLDDGSPHPDVIVCDIDMPGMDGVEFMRNVAERRLASAVVIASGLDERVLGTVRGACEGYGLQVLGAVAKPLTAAALERMLGDYRPRASAAAGGLPGSEPVAALLRALDDGTLAVTLEPVVDLAVGRVTGVRATVPGLDADDLCSAADAAGLSRRLVVRLLEQAAGPATALDLETFVTLPPGLLTDVGLADALAPAAPRGTVLVASEAALTAATGPAMFDVLARLRVKGFGLCAEGLSGPALERLPLTHAELAPSLVATAASSGDLAPLQTTVDASRSLGVPLLGRCTSAAEFDLLLQVGCSFAHGPFLAAGVPPERLPQVAREWTAPPVAVDHL
jgi:DNA-binding SARP family transcriptional activator/CheY-like chemotaxis protein/EAL domain-containing protein (putative c-di-GMP-specific phosphodiesterase class I)